MGISKVEQSLMKQLEEKGANVEHFRSLIKDYVWMNGQLKKMKKSIRDDGDTIPSISASGKEYEKENPAIKNAILYSRQMLAILKEMGLSTDTAVGDDDDRL